MKNKVNFFRARRGISLILAGIFLFNHQAIMNSATTLNLGTQAAGTSRSNNGGYNLVSKGKPVIWKSCTPINYLVSGSTTPAELETLQRAMAIETKLTGHNFQYLGATSEEASNNWASTKYQNLAYPPVLITWTDTSSDLLNGVTAGGTLANPTQSSNPVLVTGSIAFNKNIYDTLNPGFSKGTSQGNLILHELGHLLGLSHSENPSDLMYPQLSPKTNSGYTTSEINLLSTSCN